MADADSNLDTSAFRKAMGLFATGVAVLALDTPDGNIVSMTANAITSVSLQPLLLLVCVEKRANMAAPLLQAAGFSLSFLAEDQARLSDYFAGRLSEDVPDFSFVPWQGGPLLDGCIAAIGCRRYEVFESGDHWIVQGEVIALHKPDSPAQPLIFFGSRYRALAAAEGV